MANIDLGNLTRYDGKIKQYAEDKYLSKNTANWQMTEKAGAVTCYPVPDTELEPIVDFSFKEIPPTEGDKSPSNPSTIEGVSQINLTKAERNILPIISKGNVATNIFNNGVTYIKLGDGRYSFSGTTGSNGGNTSGSNNIKWDIFPSSIPKGKYTFGFIENISNIWLMCVVVKNGSPIYIGASGTSPKSVILDDSITAASFYIQFEPNTEYSNIVTPYLCVEDNIPNSACDSYISSYSLGNTYYGGSVNLATGEMTVTRFGTNQYNDVFFSSVQTNTVACDVMISHRHKGNISPSTVNSVCNYFPVTSDNNDNEHIRFTGSTDTGSYGIRVFINKSRLDLSGASDASNPTNAEWVTAFSNWLSQNNLFVSSELFNPYTVQLDPVQIKSLTALDKNIPRLNTLYTDVDSIQVGYQKHPARTAYELENAILALGGGE